MKRSFIIYLTALLLASQAFAQTTEDSVKTTVNNLFAAMKNGDAAALQNVFADSAILQTISRDKDGNVRIRNENIKAFADFVGKQPKGAADERISFETIRIDGPLAIVWTPYKFYLNNNFSHCGVNSFQLVRLKGEWKIQYLIDTRRRSSCD
jgi:hypothetical protein